MVRLEESGLPRELAGKVEELDRQFRERRYGLLGTSSNWELVGQTTAKLRVVVGNPKLHDPDGKKREKYVAIINAFDQESGTFPANFDLKTGTYIPK